MNTGQAIVAEQAAYVHRNMPTGVIGGGIVATVVVTAFWNVTPHPMLLSWFGAILVLSVIRMAQWQGRRKTAFATGDSAQWLSQSAFAAGVSGALWGVGSLFMLPDGLITHQMLFVFAIVMMTVCALFSYIAHRATFLAFFAPAIAPLFICMALKGTMVHYDVAFGLAIYSIVVYKFLGHFNETYMQAQRLRFENVSLVEQLTVQIRAANSANMAKSRFLAAASHDLRQPMHAINLYLGAMARDDLTAPTRRMLTNVTQCAQTMDEMFRALLDVSRLDAGAVLPHVQSFAVESVLARIRHEFEPQALAQGHRLSVRPSGHYVSGDAALVERIVRNLTSNAIKHTSNGRILVAARKRGQLVRVAVYDTGPGISQADQQQIFEEFYQVGNPERDRSKGMGLGLAIVDRLARLTMAPLTLVSVPGKGSMFAIDLPLSTQASQGAETPVEPTTSPSAKSDSTGMDLSGKWIVVIDDEEMIRQATLVLLEHFGCRVTTAGSASDALAQLGDSTRAPDAIICDFRLRGTETGVEAVRLLRDEFNEEIPALLVSGDTSTEKIREIRASGLRVLHKPIQEDKLRDALVSIMSEQASLAEL